MSTPPSGGPDNSGPRDGAMGNTEVMDNAASWLAKQTNTPVGKGLPSQQSLEDHFNDDVDTSPEAHHHTLGDGPNQARPGNKEEVIESFSYTGNLSVKVGVHRFKFRQPRTITAIEVTVNTAPTGAALIIDVNKNGTTIFTDQSHRPTIAVSTNDTEVTTIDIRKFEKGSYATVDIDQIGSSTAGQDLTVTLWGY